MFPPLPPQPAEANTKANASSTVESLVRRRRWSSTPIRKIPLNPNTELAIHSGNVCGVAAWWGAVVLTVSVVMPPPAIGAEIASTLRGQVRTTELHSSGEAIIGGDGQGHATRSASACDGNGSAVCGENEIRLHGDWSSRRARSCVASVSGVRRGKSVLAIR